MIQRLRRHLAAVALLIVFTSLPRVAAAAGAFRTVLVIDASSSMRSTDPRGLRKVAAELFVDLTRDGDQLAVTGFDGAARESTGAFTTIRGPADREAVKRAIRAVGNDGSWTDFTAGLGEARRLLDAAPDEPGDQEMVVFLTDGRCEPDPKGPLAEAARAAGDKRKPEEICQDKVQTDILPSLGRARVYAIGLSRGAPKAFIEKLGSSSGGVGLTTDRADELPRLFADVYARLLGGTLTGGESAPVIECDVAEGMLTADFVLGGPAPLTAKLTDPSGADVPLDNRDPTHVYFSDSPAYRLIKVAHPTAGKWKLTAGGGGRGGKYAVLQNLDLNLEFMDLPEVFEIGKQRPIRVRLATPGGKVPAPDFLDRHEVTLRIAEAQANCLGALHSNSGPPAILVKRGPAGVYEIPKLPAQRGEICFEARLSPGPSGVLSRLAWSPVRKVVPPIHLKAKAAPFGSIKQDARGSALLSFEGSEIGEAIECDITLVDPPKDISISPLRVSLDPRGERAMTLSVAVSRDAKPGARAIKATLLPVKPTGYEERAIPVDLTITVVALSFWERYGFWIEVGAGVFVFLVLLIGLVAPARFRKGAVLHTRDSRDPDLPREATYPLAAKAKAGFYRRARVVCGVTGPVRAGGVVELFAGPGGGVLVKPLGGRKARQVPRSEEEGAAPAPGEGREMPLSKGMFRASVGAKYEIEGTGLTLWITLR